MSLVLGLMLALAPADDAAQDLQKFLVDDAQNIRYLRMDNIDEKERKHYLAVVSFVLNSISNKKKITRPVLVNETLIRFDIRDYGIDAKAYEDIGTDPYTKQNKVLKKLTNSENPLIRIDWFIMKSTVAPTYYKLLGVTDLKSFQSRHDYDTKTAKKLKLEQAAIVVLGGLNRNTRYLKRTSLISGYIWEARDSASIDYLGDLLTNQYDSVQLLASNSNGLISYFAADKKGKAMDMLDADVAMDHSKSFEPDLVVRVVRNCFACHSVGVVPIEDAVRGMLNKDIKLISPNKDFTDRISELFGSKLPIKEDQELYVKAVLKATGMESKALTHKFVHIWKSYYADLTLEQAAREVGKTKDEFKKWCEETKDAHLVHLVVVGKIHRVHFEKALGGK